jgi:thymidine phosphorylase
VEQGADLEFYRKEKFFEPKIITLIKAKESGYVSFKSSSEFGMLAIQLKAGRMEKGDKLNHHNGFKLLVKHGDKVKQYDEIIEIYSDKELSSEFLENVYSNFIFSKEAPKKDKLILKELK